MPPVPIVNYNGQPLKLELLANRPTPISLSEAQAMVKRVSQDPAVEGFDQNGSVITVNGWLQCGNCGFDASRSTFFIINPAIVRTTGEGDLLGECPQCQYEEEESGFPDSCLWDVYDSLVENS